MDAKTMKPQHQLITQILLLWLSCGLSEDLSLETDDCAEMYHTCTSNSSRLPPSEMSEADFRKSQCFCDDDCWKFGDCCSDALSADKKTSLRWTCETVSPNLQHPTYAIGYCPDDWTDEEVNLQCNRNISGSNYHYLLDLPVFSKQKGRFYSNMFCAACHYDSELVPVSLFMNCGSRPNCTDIIKMNGTYQPGQLQWKIPSYTMTLQVVNYNVGNSSFDSSRNSLFPRRCFKIVDTCHPNWTGSLTTAGCNGFAKYVYGVQQMYKNKYCAECNYENDISCRRLFHRKGYADHTSGASFKWLMDFSTKPPAGQRAKCSHDEIYNPIMENCVPSPCGKNTARVAGNCISINQTNGTDLKSCPAYVVSTSDLLVLENGSIYVNQTQKIHDVDEYRQYNETAYFICSELEDDSYFMRIGGVDDSYLSIACLSISIISLAAHIVIQCIVGQIDKLPGKNLLNLSVALFLAQLLFLVGVNRTEHFGVCFAIGVAIHFFFLAVFFWVNVMAFDICWTFTSERYRPTNVKRKRTFYVYFTYAWLIPLIVVTCGVIADRTRTLPMVQPNYGIRLCWISNRYGLLIFFALPLAILLLLNILLFVTTAFWIWKTTRDCRNLKKPDECSLYYLYLKLAFIMGLTWIFGFVAALTDFKPLWYGFIILNASQGTFIFMVFTLKRKIMSQLCEKLTGKTPAFLRTNRSGDSKQTTSATFLSSIKASSPEQTNMLADEETTQVQRM